MKKLTLHFSLLLLAATLCLSFTTEDVRSVISKANKRYLSYGSYKSVVTYNYYLKSSESKPSETSTGTFMRSAKGTYSKVSALEVLENQLYRVIVDHISKTIFLEDKSKVATGEQPAVPADPYTFMELDSALKLCASSSYVKNGTGHTCTFYFKNEEFDKIIFSFDSAYVLRKTTVFFNIDPHGEKASTRLEIICGSFQKNAALPDEQFSESRYVTIRGKKAKLSSAFINYQLMSNLDQ